jgi:L-2-hydroxyglutarate oxidase LhgO
VVFDTELIRAEVDGSRIRAELRSGQDRSQMECRWLINAAGLHAVDDGLSDLVNLLGIESPGLTASLALGERMTEVLDGP